MSGLESLSLADCRGISDAGLGPLGRLRRLRHLDLSGCAVADAGMPPLSGLAALEDLGLARTQVTDGGLAYLSALHGLKKLRLDGCGAIRGSGLAHLRGMPCLEDLGLSGTNVTDAELAQLVLSAPPPRLQYLGLGDQITDAGLAAVSRLVGLRELSLCGCNISDTGLAHLRCLSGLETLLLSGCHQLTDAGLQHLRSLGGLRALQLWECVPPLGVGSMWRRLTGNHITPRGIADLQQALPGCKIEHHTRPWSLADILDW
jgi:hypothetical protein